MKVGTKALLVVVVAASKGIVESLRRIVVAADKWVEAQDEDRS